MMRLFKRKAKRLEFANKLKEIGLDVQRKHDLLSHERIKKMNSILEIEKRVYEYGGFKARMEVDKTHGFDLLKIEKYQYHVLSEDEYVQYLIENSDFDFDYEYKIPLLEIERIDGSAIATYDCPGGFIYDREIIPYRYFDSPYSLSGDRGMDLLSYLLSSGELEYNGPIDRKYLDFSVKERRMIDKACNVDIKSPLIINLHRIPLNIILKNGKKICIYCNEFTIFPVYGELIGLRICND